MIKSKLLYLALAVSMFACQQQPQQTTATAQTQTTETQVYYPGKGDNWEKKQPQQVGMDAALLQEAVEWAKQQETTQMPKDFSTQEEIFGKMLGPIPNDRASTNGIILKNGYIVAEWGETERVDPTYSVAKSVLSTILGITVDRGMIKDIQDPVANYVQDGGYDSEQNRKVTWEHHVRQTSEWEGELWGKKHDFVGKEEYGKGERKPRELQEPGTFYEYNDVRINRFASVYASPLEEAAAGSVQR
jgi:CubicO group peptidase (beta-lactamase class C family)